MTKSSPYHNTPVHSRRRGNQASPALVVLAVVFVTLALTGGFSRYDTLGLVLLRPVLALAAGILIVLPAPDGRMITRWPLRLTGALALVIALQLIPLPPGLWEALPQRERYAPAAILAEAAQPWRPISIVPVLTLNALLALLPAAVVLFGFGRLTPAQQRLGLPVLLVLAVASATLGILQLSTGADSWAYLYAKVSEGLPDGLFANRNHQAAFLAASLPLFTAWAMTSPRPARGEGTLNMSWLRIASAIAGALLALLVVLASGSRSGLVLTLANALGAAWMIAVGRSFSASRRTWQILGGALACVILVTAIAVWFGRGSGFARFMTIGERGAEMRFIAWPVLKSLMVNYLPWGSGFGTFDPLFRMHEPDGMLKPTYFNAAHNDLVELIITGGVPALLVLGGFLVWFAHRCAIVFRSGLAPSAAVRTGQAAAMFVTTFLLASLSDYPLRTPLAGALVATAVGLLERGVRSLRPDASKLVLPRMVS